MKFWKSYDGTQQVYWFDPKSFVKPLNYLSPHQEKILRSRYSKKPYFRPEVKRCNDILHGGCTPKIANY